MNIHPQTVTCQQGPENHFQYNPDLSFTLKDCTASASLSGWWDKKDNPFFWAFVHVHLPCVETKVHKFSSELQFDQFASNPGMYPPMLRPPWLFNHWSQAEWDLKVLCKFTHWFHFISPWKRKLLAPSYLVLNLSFQPGTTLVSHRNVSSSELVCTSWTPAKPTKPKSQCSFQV